MESQNAVKFFDLDTSTPIDVNAAVKNLGGNIDMFYMMLPKFEDMGVNEGVKVINKAVNEKDWLNMKEGAHTIKGSSSYIGASHL